MADEEHKEKWEVYEQCLSIKGGMKEQVDFYDETWAKRYDMDMAKLVYGGPIQLLKFIQKYVPDTNAKIIDIVAGSGILGDLLKGHGYENLEALDGSAEMLKIAQERNIYKKYHCQLLHPNEPADLPDHSYDLAIAAGVFAPAHLNSDHLMVFPQLVKKGGKCIFVVNYKFFTDHPKFAEWEWDYDLDGRMRQMEADGIWKRLEGVTIDGYYHGVPGKYFVFEVL